MAASVHFLLCKYLLASGLDLFYSKVNIVRNQCEKLMFIKTVPISPCLRRDKLEPISYEAEKVVLIWFCTLLFTLYVSLLLFENHDVYF